MHSLSTLRLNKEVVTKFKSNQSRQAELFTSGKRRMECCDGLSVVSSTPYAINLQN